MSSEQDKDLVAKRKCMLHVVLLDLITHKYIYVFCHMSVLETRYNFLERSNWFPLEICFKFTQNAFITVKHVCLCQNRY